MSFGAARPNSEVAHALEHFSLVRKKEVLFFAAAGNEGGNMSSVMFPARHPSVIAVHGTDENGTWDMPRNPLPSSEAGGLLFAALSKEVPCFGLNSRDGGRTKAIGSSFATAIVAAFVGSIMAYLNVIPESALTNSTAVVDPIGWLRRQPGMTTLLAKLDPSLHDRKFVYVRPDIFWDMEESRRRRTIENALDEWERGSG